MPRPKKSRKVYQPPIFTDFKPIGIGARFIDTVVMTIDEYEAIRLVDYEGLSHEEAAQQMEISRPTLTRLLDSAHRKIAEMLVFGKHLKIEGGNVDFRYGLIRCMNCGHLFKIEPSQTITACPNCGSTNLLHLTPPWRHRHRKGWKP